MSDSVEVKLRKETGTRASRKLRREGLVPAVLYGHGEKCVDLVATREAVQAAVRHANCSGTPTASNRSMSISCVSVPLTASRSRCPSISRASALASGPAAWSA